MSRAVVALAPFARPLEAKRQGIDVALELDLATGLVDSTPRVLQRPTTIARLHSMASQEPSDFMVQALQLPSPLLPPLLSLHEAESAGRRARE